MEIGSFRDYCVTIRKVNYNHTETQVERLDVSVVTTKEVKDTKKSRNLAAHG